MARRKGRKTTRRRRKQGISLLGVAETVALSNVATQALFNTNAVDFVMGGNNFGNANQITLRELFKPTQSQRMSVGGTQLGGGTSYNVEAGSTFSLMQANLQSNWVQGAIGMVTVPLVFKGIKAVGRPAISKVNALLRRAGIASTVKV
jgi:hypothetical protein